MQTTHTLRLIEEFLIQGGYSRGIDAEELERESDLVAAAPELLEVLEQCLKRGWMWDNDPDLYDVAARVIREAKGN